MMNDTFKENGSIEDRDDVEEDWRRQLEMLANRIVKNRRRLKPWVRREGIHCYRVYDRDIPEIPLTVDWYQGRLHIADFSGHQKDEATRKRRRGQIAERLAGALSIKTTDIFVKFHMKAAGGTQYPKVAHKGRRIPVQEGELEFLVNLSDFVDTGLFLDHRNTRKMVRDEAEGKRCLNLFAYTGAFSVYAAAGGAAQTVTVDLSNTYLEWAEENMRRNGFRGPRHRFVRDDILLTLESRAMAGTYDLVIVDPPTVSKSKAMRRPFDVQRDHVLILNRVLERVSSGGVVYFSTNAQRFKLRKDEITCGSIKEITEDTVPLDFRNRRAHRCWRLVNV
jgi:23S rRNA G2069 N7-methylase RlmK/C1962 C5-methylase RlmI